MHYLACGANVFAFVFVAGRDFHDREVRHWRADRGGAGAATATTASDDVCSANRGATTASAGGATTASADCVVSHARKKDQNT